MPTQTELTGFLKDWAEGDRSAEQKIAPVIYDEMRRSAARLFARERAGHTLQPTALVHEAFANLIAADVEWKSRSHFYALASRMMRRILIDHAKAKNAQKRGGGMIAVTLNEEILSNGENGIGLLDLADSLDAFEAEYPRPAQLVELHYFGGLTVDEICAVTDLSPSTVGRDLRFARAWLKNELTIDKG
ncbi:sigma-70 family RNA polymerase sigma factor [Parvularcula flava]|nr:sigma-70 family RNA polymerase sigma factor [Aquisalinus luteolus]NHK27042.1 sigma-70 family RNA polymerase sigma factor [Aquisalinus luteolus]